MAGLGLMLGLLAVDNYADDFDGVPEHLIRIGGSTASLSGCIMGCGLAGVMMG